MGYFIRSATPDDAEGIIEVLNPIIRAGNLTVMDNPLSIDEQVEYMRNFPARGVFLVAVDDGNGQILGLQSVEPLPDRGRAFEHVCEISTFVGAGSRGMGIGASLSKTTFVQARERGFLKICASIRGDNPNAVAFYLSQGFRIIGTAQKHALIDGNFIDEVLAERSIE